MREEISKMEGDVEFKGSNGWFGRFCKRYNLKSRRITGCSKQLPSNAPGIIWSYLESVNDIIDEDGEDK